MIPHPRIAVQHAERDRLVEDLKEVHSASFFAYHFIVGIALRDRFEQNVLEGLLFLDPSLWKLRPLKDRDTKLLKNRQNPGDDFRKDEFLSELGLEAHLVEGNMLVKNVSSYIDE